MKNGIKTLAVWIIGAMIFIVLLNSVYNNSDYKMSYSELLNKGFDEKSFNDIEKTNIELIRELENMKN